MGQRIMLHKIWWQTSNFLCRAERCPLPSSVPSTDILSYQPGVVFFFFLSHDTSTRAQEPHTVPQALIGTTLLWRKCDFYDSIFFTRENYRIKFFVGRRLACVKIMLFIGNFSAGVRVLGFGFRLYSTSTSPFLFNCFYQGYRYYHRIGYHTKKKLP
ncbi:hypothetical protein HOY82DRAFT_44956 [Tuber indicum]|nr:hypothetical protein HOY82DRAFT_44956 [Tuber indicum]